MYYGGRGGAKSWAFAQALLLMGSSRKLRVLCAREFQSSIRESVHKLLADTIHRLGLGSFYDIQQNTIKGENGTHFIFEGLKNNITKIKSMEGIDIVWCEEAETISEASWDILVPTIRKEHSEIWASFNPSQEMDATHVRFITPYEEELEANNFYTDINIHVNKVSWRDNPWFPNELRKEMEVLKQQDYKKYLHVWEGECKLGVEGSIYGAQLGKLRDEGRIMSLPIESSVQVDTFWDLGRNDTTAIWFMQRVGMEHRFIDYYESRLVGLDHYARVIKEKNYLYGEHYLPHDGNVVELQTNTSRKEFLEQMGINPITIVPRIPSIEEGIEITRQKFASCYFDKTRCADGLKALHNYQYLFDEKYQTFRRTPLHNWASNGADAFRQFAQGYADSTGIYSEYDDWSIPVNL